MAQSKVTFKVITFDGDAGLLDFFFNQVKTLAKIHKWRDVETIQFIGSKLAGAALQYFTQNPSIYTSDSLEYVEKEFRSFFSPMSETAALVEFNNLFILPQESIKNFANRINILTPMVYSEIKDENAIDHIKFTKFISTIPANLRIKIREEKISNFKCAVDRAQALQEIMQNEKILQACPPSTSVDNLTDKLNEIAERLNALSFTKHTLEKEETASQHPTKSPIPHRQKYKSKFTHGKQDSNKNRSNKGFSASPICQLCSKRGHVALRCFKWTRNNPRKNNFSYKNRFQRQRDNSNLNE